METNIEKAYKIIVDQYFMQGLPKYQILQTIKRRYSGINVSDLLGFMQHIEDCYA